MQQSHYTTVQISGIRLHLREDLCFAVREYGGQPTYVIEDEFNSRFYRVGQAEYTFISMLDGRTTFADAFGRTASIMKEEALSESQAAALCKWMIQTGLASTEQSRSSERLFDASERIRRKKLRGKLNLIFLKVPLGNPDDAMALLSRWCGWMLSLPALAVWLIVSCIALACVSSRWHEVTAMTSSVISGYNWVWLVGTWLLLKVIHESAHGVACRRYGGAVREAGVMMILFVPLPYLDVSSAWRLDSRLQRIVISAAGMYAELFLAGLAAILWFHTEPGIAHQQAFNVMLTASLISLLFNANPLMRFDGYYILSDLLEMPNLATHGQTCLRELARRFFFGLPTQLSRWPEGRSWLVISYGIAALLWRVLICAALAIAADAMFHGAGIVLAALAVTTWIVVPALSVLKFVLWGTETEKPSRRRFCMVVVGLSICCFALVQMPWVTGAVAPVVVDYSPGKEVRAATSGFIEDVIAKCGQSVQRGDLIMRLDNPELQVERQQIHSQLLQAQQRARLHHQHQEIAAWQVELETSRSLAERLEQLDQRLAALDIYAPCDGVVLDPDLQQQLGRWVSSGAHLVSIGSEQEKSLIALIDEEQIDAFSSYRDGAVTVYIDGNGLHSERGVLQAPQPSATTSIIHPAFAASAGGPIDVRVAKPTDVDQQTSGNLEFLKPHFRALINLDSQAMSQLAPGRMGIVKFHIHRGSVGEAITRSVRTWLKRQIRANEEA